MILSSIFTNPPEDNKKKGREGKGRGGNRGGQFFIKKNAPTSSFEGVGRPGSLKHPSYHTNANSNHNKDIPGIQIHEKFHSKAEDCRLDAL